MRDAAKRERRRRSPVDVLGAAALSILCGHWRYAPIDAVRGDQLNPPLIDRGLLGRGGLLSGGSLFTSHRWSLWGVCCAEGFGFPRAAESQKSQQIMQKLTVFPAVRERRLTEILELLVGKTRAGGGAGLRVFEPPDFWNLPELSVVYRLRQNISEDCHVQVDRARAQSFLEARVPICGDLGGGKLVSPEPSRRSHCQT
jgi:hypothetical protein